MISKSIYHFDSGFCAYVCRRPEDGKYIVRINDEDDVEVLEIVVEAKAAAMENIAAAAVRGYIRGRDDGRHQMMDVVTRAAQNAWRE